VRIREVLYDGASEGKRTLQERQAVLHYPYEECKFFVFGTSLNLVKNGRN
jgi:hypothetical protein